MKKFWCVLAMLVLSLVPTVCLASFAGGGLGEGEYVFYVVNDKTNLNVRQGPGTQYAILEEIPYGALVRHPWEGAYGAPLPQNGWVPIEEITNDGQGARIGWVYKELLTEVQRYVVPNLDQKPLPAVVNANDSNLRDGASSRCGYITTVQAGTKAEIYASAQGWYYIGIPSLQRYGWMYGGYLTKQ